MGAELPWRFVLKGAPRTKKTSQQIVRNKATGRQFIVGDKVKVAWEKSAVEQLIAQRGPTETVMVRRKGKMVPAQVQFMEPVGVKAIFYREKNLGDATGFYQALADALEKAGIVTNDKLIEHWDGSRRLIDRENPRVEVEVIPL